MNTDGLVELFKEVCNDEPILVAQAYRFFEDEMSLLEFKSCLFQAWRQGKVSLSRCDMPELFVNDKDAKEVQERARAMIADSLIRHGVGEFHMVQAKAWK